MGWLVRYGLCLDGRRGCRARPASRRTESIYNNLWRWMETRSRTFVNIKRSFSVRANRKAAWIPVRVYYPGRDYPLGRARGKKKKMTSRPTFCVLHPVLHTRQGAGWHRCKTYGLCRPPHPLRVGHPSTLCGPAGPTPSVQRPAATGYKTRGQASTRVQAGVNRDLELCLVLCTPLAFARYQMPSHLFRRLGATPSASCPKSVPSCRVNVSVRIRPGLRLWLGLRLRLGLG